MYSGEKLNAFRKHWNYTPNDATEFERFCTRADAVLRVTWSETIKPNDRLRQKFALISGTRYLSWEKSEYLYSSVSRTLEEEATLDDILEAVQFVLWTMEDL